MVVPATGEIMPLLRNPTAGPASGAPEHPIGLAFAPDGSLYVTDVGVIPSPTTGAICWVVPPRDAATTP